MVDDSESAIVVQESVSRLREGLGSSRSLFCGQLLVSSTRAMLFTSAVEGDVSEDVRDVFEEEGPDIIFQASTKLGKMETTQLFVLHFIPNGK